MSNRYLIWLNWPEKCFRIDAEALRCLKGLVKRGSTIKSVASEGEFLKELPRATHAIVWSFKSEWFALAPRLKLLATPAAGRELVPEKGPKGVKIHFGHCHGKIISESVLGFMLCWAKGFFAVRAAPKACRNWPRVWLSERCYDVRGTKAVILGYGNVGRTIGSRLESEGVEVIGVTRHGVFRGKRKVAASFRPSRDLRNADWLILALPSTTGTDDFLDAKMLACLPPRAVVINVGRGNSVDERALVKALKAGKIAGAYLDVYKLEQSEISGMAPGKRSAGYISVGSNDLSNLILMPHSSAFSANYIKLVLEELKDDGCL